MTRLKYTKLSTPLERESVLQLKLGDRVVVSGTIFSMRDQAIQRILKEGQHGKNIPGLKNAIIYNCGPLARKKGGKWDLVSAGPTTSSRMNPLMPSMINDFGISAVIGKGGMSLEVLRAMKGKCVYLSAVGGSGALAAEQLQVQKVQWLDLGMPEALWTLKANEFGSLIVTMDAHGHSLYENVSKKVRKNLESQR